MNYFHAHWKPGGIDLPHALRSKLSATGTFKLIPSTLALMAVHRQRAASKSAKPSSTAQHLSPEGGLPTTTWTSPSRSTQTPSFSVSLGQVVGAGEGVGLCLQGSQALENAEKERRERIKMQAESFLEAIAVAVD